MIYASGKVWQILSKTKVWSELKPCGMPPSEWTLIKSDKSDYIKLKG